jgi:DNA-binding PadR family transcriptional regulator
MERTTLSEIEGCVLALVHELGPVTPYAIRKDFLGSPTPQWSGSAGTIYPLVERLLRRGLIRAKSCYTGDREGRRISLTPAGRRAFHRWLSVPMPHWVAGVPPDPLRTRVRFLGALPTAVQKAFVKEAQVKARRQLRVLARDYELQKALGPFQALMSRGAVLSMRSRLSFLDEVAAALHVN